MNALAKRSGTSDSNPGKLWPWLAAGGVVVVAGGAFGTWWWWRKKKTAPVFPGVPETPAPPAGYEVTTCEKYKGHTLCVVKPLEGMPKWFAWTYDGGAPNGEHALPPLAMAAARAFVDSLESEPLPPVTEPEGEGGPVAGAEGGDATPDFASGTAGQGITVQFGSEGQCQAFTVNDLGKWLTYATELLEGLNLAAWSSQQLMDQVWSVTFPQCAELSEVPGVTIGGQPYAAIVESGQAFLDTWKFDAILLSPGKTIESVFAGFMVGQAYVAPPPPPTDATKFPQFEMGAASVLAKVISTTGVKWTIVILPQSVYEPAAAQHVFSAPWWAWSEGTVLVKSQAQHSGKAPDADQALEQATQAVG